MYLHYKSLTGYYLLFFFFDYWYCNNHDTLSYNRLFHILLKLNSFISIFEERNIWLFLVLVLLVTIIASFCSDFRHHHHNPFRLLMPASVCNILCMQKRFFFKNNLVFLPCHLLAFLHQQIYQER